MVAYLRSHPALNFAPSRRPQRAYSSPGLKALAELMIISLSVWSRQVNDERVLERV